LCAAHLSDPTHQIVFHFTPKHCSGSIKLRFGLPMRKHKRGNFSQSNLKTRILESLLIISTASDGKKPFQWTYKGKALTASEKGRRTTRQSTS